ncbi:hypothetical protein [Rubripirellula lacrimiformis]|uniref:hypothetical protein n=1 Tax=Rubripirellula lacrimiformis TaxID=1930273 RepID=UPI001C54D43A|nr:hypothetical protein [Rubripirellula lacrimiformis]
MAALLAAGVLTLALVGFATTGNLNSFPRILKPLLIPGIFGLFIVGSVTGSMLFAYVAYAACMIVVYGAIGTIADLATRVWLNRRLSDVSQFPETAANHPMQPSGEVGRFEMDDQPSPPADR